MSEKKTWIARLFGTPNVPAEVKAEEMEEYTEAPPLFHVPSGNDGKTITTIRETTTTVVREVIVTPVPKEKKRLLEIGTVVVEENGEPSADRPLGPENTDRKIDH